MARDRQRSKQRRARREADGAPDPLQNASPDVDEARMAEAGAVHPDADAGSDGEVYDDELSEERAPAPDAVEGDAVARTRAGEVAPAGRGGRGRVVTFLGHSVDELRRVQWPNRRHVGQATAVVLGFVVIAGGYLGLLDALWQPLVEAIL